MPPQARLLLLALAAPQEQSSPQNSQDEVNDQLAIFIGVERNTNSTWNEKTWHVGIAKRSELCNFLTGNGSPEWKEQTIFKAFSKVSELTTKWKERLDIQAIGISDGKGGETEDRFQVPVEGGPPNHRLWIDRIYRFFLFNGANEGRPSEESSEGGIVWNGCGLNHLVPLVRLDPAAWVLNANPDTKDSEIPRKWVVSRIRLDSEESWISPGSDEDNPRAREITGFRLVAHIPVPINSHLPVEEEDASDKRFDTRAIFIAAADKKSQDTLWESASGSPQFTQLNLAFSESNGFSGDNLTNETLQSPNADSPRLLTDLFRPKLGVFGAPIFRNGDSQDADGVRSNIPLLASIQGFSSMEPTDSMTLFLRRREIGFRIVRNGTDLQVALRVEVKLRLNEMNDWKKFWDSTVRPVIPLECPEDGLVIEKEENSLDLSQEQRQEDIRVDLFSPPTEETIWILTLRLNSVQGQSPIEKIVLNRVGLLASEVVTGIGDVRPVSGISILPALEAVDNQTGLPWQLVGLLKVPAYRRRILLNVLLKDITWSMAEDPARTVEFSSLQPAQKKNHWVSSEDLSNPVRLREGREWLLDTEGLGIWQRMLQADQPKMSLSSWIDDIDPNDDPTIAAQPSLGDTGSVFFKLSQAKNDEAQKRIGATRQIQLGSLQLRTPDDDPKLQFQIDFFPATRRRDQNNNAGLQPILDRLFVVAEMLISSFHPISQDPLPELPSAEDELGDFSNRDCGLIFEMPLRSQVAQTNSPAPPLKAPPLKLRLEEKAGGKRDQMFEAKLLKQPSPEDEGVTLKPLLVIDPKPFRVALVQGSRIKSDDSGNILAIYQPGDDGSFSWKIIDPSQAYRLRLPPQCIGEAMERARTLPGSQNDIKPGEPIQVRFGSPTDLVVDPTFRDQSKGEAAWNLRRLLNRISDVPPGVLLREIRLELAYGLITRLTVAPEQLTWIAELSGVTGRPASPLKTLENDNSSMIRRHIRRVLELQNHRLAVEKVWSLRPELPFQTDKGLSFKLRSYKDVRPIPNDREKLRFPAPGSTFKEKIESEDSPEAERIKSTFSLAEASFPGGIAWAIESANVLLELYRQPESSVGRVADLHLSALGAWGRQRVEFDKTVFETDCSMGRLHTYRLERLGRIGALHNRAKHVVIYRRTVAPSPQFERVQDELLGQPVLRKSEEYIEIMEPEHRFTSGSPTVESGCLLGARFLTTRILVNGAWGQDVRDEGWKLPIWQQDLTSSDKERVQYPRPQIELIMVGEDGEERGVGIESVEKLVFYTSTTPNETAASIATWHPVEGIDYCDLPAPQVKPTVTEEDKQADLHDGFLAKPVRVPSGYDALTLDLIPSSVPLLISAGRTPTGPSAPLANVTISRANPLPILEGQNENARRKGVEAAMVGVDIRSTYEQIFGRLAGKAEQMRQNKQSVDEVIQEIKGMKIALKETLEAKRDSLKKKLASLPTLEDVNGETILKNVNRRTVQEIQKEARWMLMQTHAYVNQQLEEFRQIALVALDDQERLLRLSEDLVELLQAATVNGPIQPMKDRLVRIRTDAANRTLSIISQAQTEAKRLLSNEDIFKVNTVNRREFSFKSIVEPLIGRRRIEQAEDQISTPKKKLPELLDDINTSIIKQFREVIPNQIRAYQNQVPAYEAVRVNIERRLRPLVGDQVQELITHLQTIQASREAEVFLNAPAITNELLINTIQPLSGQLSLIIDAVKAISDVEYGLLSISVNEINSRIQELATTAALFATDSRVIQQFKAFIYVSELDSKLKDIEEVLQGSLELDLQTGDLKTGLDVLETVGKFVDNLSSNASTADAFVSELQEKIQQTIDEIDIGVSEKLTVLQRSITQVASSSDNVGLYQKGDNVLRLIRAVGNPPKAEGLVINRPEVAYVFDLVKPIVDISPCLALANRSVSTARAIKQVADAASELLQPFGVRLPVKGLAEDFVPDVLGDISLSKMIPDMAGLKLDALLPSLQLSGLGDKVKVTRGFDKVKREAWLKADIDIPLEKTTSLIAIGPLRMQLEKGRITARSRITLQADGSTQSEASGDVTGDWRLIVGELEVITFVQTPLVFSQTGKLDFKLSSKSIKLSPQLQFITTLLESIGKSIPPGVEPVLRDGIPAGILCRLTMDLPPLNSGVFGITDLTLGTSFGIIAYPEFEISTTLDIGARESPFTLSVWLLNGGGYISMKLRYLPTQSPALVVYSLDVAIVAGVGIGFAFGVISGGVWLQVGCSFAMAWSTGSADKTLTLTVFILARGSVDVAGLVTAGINLIMEASYDGDDMVARGSLRMSFRISFFYTLKVRETVKYRLKGNGRKSASNAKEYASSYG